MRIETKIEEFLDNNEDAALAIVVHDHNERTRVIGELMDYFKSWKGVVMCPLNFSLLFKDSKNNIIVLNLNASTFEEDMKSYIIKKMIPTERVDELICKLEIIRSRVIG
jgi:hypothetical protein